MEKGPQYINYFTMDRGPQYINYFNMDRGPQYICSIRKRVHNTLVNTESVHSSVWKSVHNILVQ